MSGPAVDCEMDESPRTALSLVAEQCGPVPIGPRLRAYHSDGGISGRGDTDPPAGPSRVAEGATAAIGNSPRREERLGKYDVELSGF